MSQTRTNHQYGDRITIEIAGNKLVLAITQRYDVPELFNLIVDGEAREGEWRYGEDIAVRGDGRVKAILVITRRYSGGQGFNMLADAGEREIRVVRDHDQRAG